MTNKEMKTNAAVTTNFVLSRCTTTGSGVWVGAGRVRLLVRVARAASMVIVGFGDRDAMADRVADGVS